MSKIISRNIIFLAALIMNTFFYAGCSKTNEEACEKCKPLPSDKQLNIQIGTIEKSFDLWKNAAQDEKTNYNIVIARSTYSGVELNAMLQTLNLETAVNLPAESLAGIAYMLDTDLSKEASYKLTRHNIKGLIIYYLNNEKLYAKVLLNDGGSIKTVDGLSAETKYIYSNDIERFAQHFFNNGSTAISAVLVSDYSKTGEHKGATNSFREKISKYVSIAIPAKPTEIHHYEQHGGSNCGKPCPRDGKLGCAQRAGTWTCDDLATDCAKKNLTAWNSVPEDQDLRDPILYKFKDEFMAQSAMGQHFIQDFYYIGGFLKDNLNANIAAESFTMMDNTIIPIVNKLLNNPQSTAVIYDQTTKSQLIGYIDHVRALCNDPIFLEIIDEIKANIEFFAGKTVKDTYSEIMAS